MRKGKEALVAEETPVVPQWLLNMVNEKHGCSLRFIFKKTLCPTDLNRKLRLPIAHIHQGLAPMLSHDERDDAGLINLGNLKSDKGVVARDEEEPEEHKWLRVVVYNRAGWKFYLEITCWNSGDTFLGGGQEWHNFVTFSGFQAGDEVEMWGFQEDNGSALRFVLRKNTADGAS